MIKPKIIVTGATGKTSSVVVSELLKTGYPVRALVHKEDGRSAHLKAQGAELAVAELARRSIASRHTCEHTSAEPALQPRKPSGCDSAAGQPSSASMTRKKC